MGRVHTSRSTIHGTGVFASVPILAGEIVLRLDDSRVVTEEWPLDATKEEAERHCDYLAGGKVVLMQVPERFINHSCTPNSYTRTIGKDRWVIALRDIHVGDEITYDYCLNSEGDTAWDCSCGSLNCRKRHLSGFFHLPVDLQIRYLALLEPWYLEEHRAEIEELKRQVSANHVDAIVARPTHGVGESQIAQPEIVLRLNAPLCNEEIASLFKAAWGDQAPDVPPAVEHCLAHICAYSNDRLVGFVKLAWDGGIHAFLLDTTVHPDCQRRGIGMKLVARAVEVAADSGIEWLHVDYEPPLERFYAACGFWTTTAGLIRVAGDRR